MYTKLIIEAIKLVNAYIRAYDQTDRFLTLLEAVLVGLETGLDDGHDDGEL